MPRTANKQLRAQWTRCALATLFALLSARDATAQSPVGPQTPLPRSEVIARLDVENHVVTARQRITWTNTRARAARELTFNVFAHYELPEDDIGFEAKMLELSRTMPSEALDYDGKALEINQIRLLPAPLGRGGALPLRFAYWPKSSTILDVSLPAPLLTGQSITVEIEFRLRLPRKQGRWGRWKDITCLTHWLPVLANYDEQGWHPVPFVLWFPAAFNDAAQYHVWLTLPANEKIASTSPAIRRRDLGDNRVEVEFEPVTARDFGLLTSSRFEEFISEVDGIQIRCLAFKDYEFYAQTMLRAAGAAIAAMNRAVGRYPYRSFTIAQSYVGWAGASCAGIALMDERIFNMPHLGHGMAEFVVMQQTCRQWWSNVIGSNGYSELWLDLGPATYFAHRQLDRTQGKNSALVDWPTGFGWLPNIERDTFRYFNLYGTIGRGEAGPTLQDIPGFEHTINLFSHVCDRGGKVVGMIEDRMGQRAFVDFMHRVYARYYFRVLTVADLQRELESYTGQSWQEFFQHWLYGAGMVDWAVEKVQVARKPDRPLDTGTTEKPAVLPAATNVTPPPAPLPGYRVAVTLRQKADYNESTILGFAFDGGKDFRLRVPISTNRQVVVPGQPPANVEVLPDNQVRIETWLPQPPTQVVVDPDNVLLDREPANNYWKPPVRWRFTPLYTPLEETDLTCAHDRWNVLCGPWVSDSAYSDPWFSFTELAGARIGLYRTQQFIGGFYTGYRTNFFDICLGADALRLHWPYPQTQVGFNYEMSIASFGRHGPGPDRGIVYGRYVFDETDSLYLLPMHYVEAFFSNAQNYFPTPRQEPPGAARLPVQTTTGLRYHINYLTPYWDPEGGFQFDATWGAGLPLLGQPVPTQQFSSQLSVLQEMPEGFGWFSETRLAMRLFGAIGGPSRFQMFTLGGSELFRGFDLSERQGSLVWIGSLEWRIPIVKRLDWDIADHTARLHSAYTALFYDVGNAYIRHESVGPTAHAIGVSLRLDVAWFSFLEHSMLRLDVAKTLNADSALQFWVGAEHPF